MRRTAHAQRPGSEQREPTGCCSVMLGSRHQQRSPCPFIPFHGSVWPRQSLNHPIRSLQQRGRHREAERLGGLEVDDEFELAGLLDRKVGGLRALEDFVHEGGSAPLQVKRAWAIKHKTAGLRVLAHPIYRGQAPLRRELCDLSSLIRKYGG